MKVIYPEEVLTLLAKYDGFMSEMTEYYQRHYPNPKDCLRNLLEDPYYQACVQAKAKIISLSTCTYQFDANEEILKPHD